MPEVMKQQKLAKKKKFKATPPPPETPLTLDLDLTLVPARLDIASRILAGFAAKEGRISLGQARSYADSALTLADSLLTANSDEAELDFR